MAHERATAGCIQERLRFHSEGYDLNGVGCKDTWYVVNQVLVGLFTTCAHHISFAIVIDMTADLEE